MQTCPRVKDPCSVYRNLNLAGSLRHGGLCSLNWMRMVMVVKKITSTTKMKKKKQIPLSTNEITFYPKCVD
jgi:hypothetical protein